MSINATPRTLTYGAGAAARVIVGSRLGIQTSMGAIAEQMLRGQPVAPAHLGELDRESSRIHEIVRKDPDMFDRARTTADAVLTEYGYV